MAFRDFSELLHSVLHSRLVEVALMKANITSIRIPLGTTEILTLRRALKPNMSPLCATHIVMLLLETRHTQQPLLFTFCKCPANRQTG